MTKTARFSLCLLAATFLSARSVFADVGIIVLEPIKTLGYMTRAGHAATFLSNICPDGSPVRMRLCHTGERGGVVSKYTPISENGDYDWAIVPFDEFLHGVGAEELAPLIATDRLRAALQVDDFTPLFSSAIKRLDNGTLPDGEWKATLATRFDRTLYKLSVVTTLEEDRRIVEAFNTADNTSHFNFFYDNCSDQARALLSLVLPDNIGDRRGGLTMETPKGLARALVQLAQKHPELELRVERYLQTPGVASRSREVLFPMENVYRNLSYAPYWFFGGFREFALGAFIYHEVIARFSIDKTFRTFAVAEKVRQNPGARQAELDRVFGTDEHWRAYAREFQRVVAEAVMRVPWPAFIRAALQQAPSSGRLSQDLLALFEAQGQISLGEWGRGPWMTLPLAGADVASTGLSEAEIGEGDPRLAFLVLASVIDFNLGASDTRRETASYMQRMLDLLRQASVRLSSRPAIS